MKMKKFKESLTVVDGQEKYSLLPVSKIMSSGNYVEQSMSGITPDYLVSYLKELGFQKDSSTKYSSSIIIVYLNDEDMDEDESRLLDNRDFDYAVLSSSRYSITKFNADLAKYMNDAGILGNPEYWKLKVK